MFSKIGGPQRSGVPGITAPEDRGPRDRGPGDLESGVPEIAGRRNRGSLGSGVLASQISGGSRFPKMGSQGSGSQKSGVGIGARCSQRSGGSRGRGDRGPVFPKIGRSQRSGGSRFLKMGSRGSGSQKSGGIGVRCSQRSGSPRDRGSRGSRRLGIGVPKIGILGIRNRGS